MSGPTSLRWGSATDTGRVRAVNQDSSLAANPIFAVADGMGGHAAGEVASQVAVESLRDNASPSRQGLVDAVRLANRAVLDRADGDPELRGMGTTLCAIALVDGPGDDVGGRHVVVANVGDSRVYLFHDDDLLQLTDDHSFVEELVRQGRLTPEEAKVHPQKNIVTRVLGNEADVAVDSWEVDPFRGDRFLLCSDGLFNEVDDDRIAEVLRRVDDPDDAARELVRLANEHGGRDNITVVLVDVVDDGGRSASASAALADEPGTSARRGGPPGAATATATAAPPRDAPRQRNGEVPPATVAEAAPKPRRVTLRSVTFVFAVLLVLGAAVGSVYWFSRSAYFVGLDDEEIAIYQGRPGGVLWIDPTLTERTGLTLDDVPPARHTDLAAGKEETSLEAARRYVGNLEAQGAELARRANATTTTAPTTTTDPAATADPTTPADPTAGTGTDASPDAATP